MDFTHKLTDSSGYAYIYYKKVSSTKARPELVLEHRLKNVGSKTIETNVYNHNFFVIDHQLSGPNFVIKFPFNIRANPEPKGLAYVAAMNLHTSANCRRTSASRRRYLDSGIALMTTTSRLRIEKQEPVLLFEVIAHWPDSFFGRSAPYSRRRHTSTFESSRVANSRGRSHTNS